MLLSGLLNIKVFAHEGTKGKIFHHKKELVDEMFKEKTLDEMNLHTGFSLLAYDLVRSREMA